MKYLKFLIILIAIICLPTAINFIHLKLHNNYFDQFGERTFLGTIDRSGHFILEKFHSKLHQNKEVSFINFVDYIWHYFNLNQNNVSLNKNYVDSRQAEANGLNIDNIFEINAIDSSTLSKTQLTRYINKNKNQSIESSVRKHLIYDYPFTFAYSSSLKNLESNELKDLDLNAKKLDNYISIGSKNNIIEQSELVSKLSSKYIFSQFKNLDDISKSSEIEIIFDKQINETGKSYRLIYFAYSTGIFDLNMLGALYLPLKLNTNLLIINPLGCGSKIGDNDKTDRQHSRMASLAENGLPSLALTSLCSNPPFDRYNDNGFARQHMNIFHIARSKINSYDIELRNYQKVISIIKNKYKLNTNKYGMMGYSYGAVQSNELLKFMDGEYLVHVSTSIHRNAENLSRFFTNDLKIKYIFSKYDSLIPYKKILNDISIIENYSKLTNKKFIKEIYFNDDSSHNFGDQKSNEAVKFLLENKNIQCNPCYQFRESSVDFSLPKEYLKKLTNTTFFDAYKNYVIDNNKKSRQLAKNISKEDLLKKIRSIFNINNDNHKENKIFLINTKKFFISTRQYEYNSWNIEFMNFFNSILYSYENVNPTNKSILLITDDISDEEIKFDIIRYLESGYNVLMIELFGYGHSKDSQAPIGILTKELPKIRTSIVDINIKFINEILNNNVDVNFIKTYGPESSILIDIYGFLNNYTGKIIQQNAFDDFEYFFDSKIKPVIPPIILVTNIYPDISFRRLRELKPEIKTQIISKDNMQKYIATQ